MDSYQETKSGWGKFGLEGQGLRSKLFIVQALVFVIPSLSLAYVLSQSKIDFSNLQLIIISFILLLILAGLVIVRQIFDNFLTITSSVKKAVATNEYLEDIRVESKELSGINQSFNDLMLNFRQATDDLKQRAFELVSIRELNEVATRIIDIDELLKTLLQKTMAVTYAEIGSIFMVEADKGHFRVVASRGAEPALKIGSYVNIKNSVVRSVVETRQPLVVSDIETDARTLKSNDPNYGAPSLISMPIFVGRRLVAVLNLACKEKQRVFDHNDEQILSIMITEIGFALENASLHAKANRNLSALEKRTAELGEANEKLKKEVAERIQAESSLRRSEERYRILFENANDAIFVLQDDRIKFPNPQAEQLRGQLSPQVDNIRFSDFVHADDREFYSKKQNDSLAGDAVSLPYSFRMCRQGGDELWVDMNSVPITWEGQPATLSFLRDFTKRKQLEEQLIESQRLKAIGTLAGGIAHDFNNLLMGIQGNVSLLLVNMAQEDPNYENLVSIERCIASGGNLTKQLLGFARGGKYKVKPTELNDIVRSTTQLFGQTQKNVTIAHDLDLGLWVVDADQGQIEQVLFNIYLNAGQAMPRGGTLTLTTRNIEIDDQQALRHDVSPGRYVNISIADTGTGIDVAHQHRIFEPFFTTKPMGSSTGLGLSSAYGIVKNHSGIIDFESENGAGTTFNVYLPASEGKPEEETDQGDDSILTGSEKILMVDDEEYIIAVGKPMLQALGYEVLVAKDGKRAIETFKAYRSRIDLVILDMIMPEMNGIDVFDRLKQINPDVKVLLQSGYSRNINNMEIQSRDFDGFIQKPFSLIDLSKKLRDILDRPPGGDDGVGSPVSV